MMSVISFPIKNYLDGEKKNKKNIKHPVAWRSTVRTVHRASETGN